MADTNEAIRTVPELKLENVPLPVSAIQMGMYGCCGNFRQS